MSSLFRGNKRQTWKWGVDWARLESLTHNPIHSTNSRKKDGEKDSVEADFGLRIQPASALGAFIRIHLDSLTAIRTGPFHDHPPNAFVAIPRFH